MDNFSKSFLGDIVDSDEESLDLINLGGIMAPLPDEDRVRIRRGLSRWWSNQRDAMNLSRVDLAAAIVATDDWIDSNQASYNSALPVAARTNLTAIQKALLFCAVALARVSINLLRAVFSEVD